MALSQEDSPWARVTSTRRFPLSPVSPVRSTVRSFLQELLLLLLLTSRECPQSSVEASEAVSGGPSSPFKDVSDDMLREAQECEERGCLIQLLSPSKESERFRPLTKKLQPTAKAIRVLRQIEEPLALVAAVGQYHSGKSLLLNVLLNSTRGFTVGSLPTPETQGLWMRILPKDGPRAKDGARVGLIDTEGMYGEGAPSMAYEAQVFGVATLLSSHLLFNTMRTLGDSRSVAALSDLAWRARVLNLHAWLHSASTPTADLEHAPEDKIANDLIQLLDFPVLTWVVQNFDMELPPQDTPMAYLKYYLDSHAMTGDHSLQALFTKGIMAHTLKTPTDLNSVRLGMEEEQFGALHPDYLADLARLRQHVWDGLEAKAGGNLTGKVLADLLPLLAHFANEEFPLAADKKLRDVVAEHRLNLALESAVELFNTRMTKFLEQQVLLAPPPHALPSAPKALGASSSLREREGQQSSTVWCSTGTGQGGAVVGGQWGLTSARDKSQQGAKPGAASSAGRIEVPCPCGAAAFSLAEDVQALLQGTPSQQAVEKKLGDTVEDAVGYCVHLIASGLPEVMISSTCRQKLRDQLRKMKAPHTERQESLAARAIGAVGEELQKHGVQCVQALGLPMSEAELDCLCQHISSMAQNRFTELLSMLQQYSTNTSWLDAKDRMEEQISRQCRAAKESNSRWVEGLLNRAKEAAKEAYRSLVAKAAPALLDPEALEDTRLSKAGPGCDAHVGEHSKAACASNLGPVPVKNISELHVAAAQAVDKTFRQAVDAGGMPWVRLGHAGHDMAMFHLEKWGKEQEERLWRTNEGLIVETCMEALGGMLEEALTEMEGIRPFPDNHEVVAAKAAGTARGALQNFGFTFEQFKGSPALDRCMDRMEAELEQGKKDVEERNTKQMALLFHAPLAAAKKELTVAQDCLLRWENVFGTSSFWSPKCLLPLKGRQWPLGLGSAARGAALKHMLKAREEADREGLLDRPSEEGGPMRIDSHPGQRGFSDSLEGEGSSTRISGGEPREGSGGEAMVTGGVVGQPFTGLSEQTMHRVVREWMDQDLRNEFDIVRFNLGVLVSFVLVIISLLVWCAGGLWRAASLSRWTVLSLLKVGRGLYWGVGRLSRVYFFLWACLSSPFKFATGVPSAPEVYLEAPSSNGHKGFASLAASGGDPDRFMSSGTPALKTFDRSRTFMPCSIQAKEVVLNRHPSSTDSLTTGPLKCIKSSGSESSGDVDGIHPPDSAGKLSGAYFRSSDGQWRRFKTSPFANGGWSD